MKKIYHFNYDCYNSEVVITIDTHLFTKAKAQSVLDFFDWDYDKKADPIDEAVKKYALHSIWIGMRYDYNLYGVREYINKESEGYIPLGKETGTPYSMSDGYKSVALVDRVFENEKEAMQFMRRIVMQKASEKVR